MTGQTPAGNPIFAHDQPYPNSWIEEKARENNKLPDFPIPKEKAFKKSRKSPFSRGEKVMNFLYRLVFRGQQ